MAMGLLASLNGLSAGMEIDLLVGCISALRVVLL